MTVLLGAAPSIIGPSEVGAWMAASGAPGAAALLDFAAQRYGFRSAAGVPRRGSIEADLTFARASAAGRWPESGPYEMVGSGVLRYDHDPITREPLGARIESPAAPLSIWTTDFSATAPKWGNYGGFPSIVDRPSIFAGGVAAEHYAPSGQGRSQTYTLAANTDYRIDAILETTLSLPPYFFFGLYRNGSFLGALNLDWASGGTGGGVGVISGVVVEDLGVGPSGGQLKRLSCVVNSGEGGATGFLVYPCGSFASAEGQSCILHYACCTPGAMYRSLMPIAGTVQARAADGLYQSLEGIDVSAGFTVAVDVTSPPGQNPTDSNTVFSAVPPTGFADRFGIICYGYSTYLLSIAAGGTIIAANVVRSGGVPGEEVTLVLSWSPVHLYRAVAQGGTLVKVASPTPPSASISRIGWGNRAGGAQFGGTIKRAAVWPHGDFSDEQLQGLLA